jgi:hypothetical protein
VCVLHLALHQRERYLLQTSCMVWAKPEYMHVSGAVHLGNPTPVSMNILLKISTYFSTEHRYHINLDCLSSKTDLEIYAIWPFFYQIKINSHSVSQGLQGLLKTTFHHAALQSSRKGWGSWNFLTIPNWIILLVMDLTWLTHQSSICPWHSFLK